MEKFCKLFETEDLGQILVKIDQNEEGNPEVRFFVKPENLGVCAVASSYSDDDSGWDLAEEWFSRIDLELARKRATNIFKMVSETVEND